MSYATHHLRHFWQPHKIAVFVRFIYKADAFVKLKSYANDVYIHVSGFGNLFDIIGNNHIAYLSCKYAVIVGCLETQLQIQNNISVAVLLLAQPINPFVLEEVDIELNIPVFFVLWHLLTPLNSFDFFL